MPSDSAQRSYTVSSPTVLAPLSCKNCSAPLAVSEAESVRCPHCGATNQVPEGYRALLVARTAPAALRSAEREWLRFKPVTLSPMLAMIAGALPAVIFIMGLLIALIRGISNPNAPPGAAEFVGRFVLLPLVPALALSFFALSLHFAEGALFAKCIYCETESLVATDALHARARSYTKLKLCRPAPLKRLTRTRAEEM
ncbi:MAG: hypothetical protein M3362_13820 [Acidobacteriota bacterium]|nr:hypothetical protein [Acidobacteriota bacterium]